MQRLDLVESWTMTGDEVKSRCEEVDGKFDRGPEIYSKECQKDVLGVCAGLIGAFTVPATR